MSLIVTVGGETSNSYVSLLEADTYLASHPDSTVWGDFGDSKKEYLLRIAAQMLEESNYQYMGTRANELQNLAFPRMDLYKFGDSNLPIDPEIIPQNVKDAQCELALWTLLIHGNDYSSVSLAGMSVSKRGAGDKERPYIIGELLKPFLKYFSNPSMINANRMAGTYKRYL